MMIWTDESHELVSQGRPAAGSLIDKLTVITLSSSVTALAIALGALAATPK